MASLALALVVAASAVNAQSSTTSALEPLSSKHFTYPDIPYQVSGTDAGPRGPQFGFNLCNSTTQNQESDCQTMFVNAINDFCMWSSPTPNNTIGESEAYEVAWCMLNTWGTRQIPAGAVTGVQFLYAKSYIQVVGYIDQTQVNLNAGDYGGELDPHGDDQQGNPLGGIAYTNGFDMTADLFDSQLTSNTAPSTSYTQVEEWIDFIGNNMFCMKMCNPANPNAPELCQHVYDEIGCTYNAPADYNAINNTFTVCDSDDMVPPGVFTEAGGETTTWFQPWSGTWTVPYSVTVPASSNCHTYSSEQLFGSVTYQAGATGSAAGTAATGAATGASGKPGASGKSGGAASGSRTGSGAGASNTSDSSAVARAVSSGPFYALVAVMATSFIAPLLFL
jgi:hypothetical protein